MGTRRRCTAESVPPGGRCEEEEGWMNIVEGMKVRGEER